MKILLLGIATGILLGVTFPIAPLPLVVSMSALIPGTLAAWLIQREANNAKHSGGQPQ
jgi:hypothetical protein